MRLVCSCAMRAHVEPEGGAPEGVSVHVAGERQEDPRLVSDEAPDLPRERKNREALAVLLHAVSRASGGEERGVSKAEESHRDSIVDRTLRDSFHQEAAGRGLDAARQQCPTPDGPDACAEILIFEKRHGLVEAADCIEPVGVDEQALISVDGLGTAERRQALVVGECGCLCIMEPQLEVSGEWCG